MTKSLHVGLDLVFLVPGETGGVETYARELIGAVLRRGMETMCVSDVFQALSKLIPDFRSIERNPTIELMEA
jgi:hypothetical protein